MPKLLKGDINISDIFLTLKARTSYIFIWEKKILEIVDGILNSNDIEQILENAKNPAYKTPGFIILSYGNQFYLSIVKISKKRLIFIVGNKNTGIQHINYRHTFISFPKDWFEEKDYRAKNVKRLDNPSRFNIEAMPHIHYPEIADDIYDSTNLNTDKNKHPELFDLYEGRSNKLGGKMITYRLILYKDTPIVHSLFPTERKSKRKRKINYAKGKAELIKHLNDPDYDYIVIPYLDQNNIERYKIIIRRDNFNGIELIYLQVNRTDGQPFKTIIHSKRNTEANIDIQKYWNNFYFNDLPGFEKIIKEFENNL